MKTPYEQALHDYHNQCFVPPLKLHTSYDDEEEMPVEVFFRNEHELLAIEIEALRRCRGHVLDAGAGAGSLSLALQSQQINVTALDIFSGSVQIMKERGVKQAICADIFRYHGQQFDTLLLMMNGIGLAGTTGGLHRLLKHFHKLLAPGGQIIFDSSDISYITEEGVTPTGRYVGEIRYQYEYRGKKGQWFHWLYIDAARMEAAANACGWQMQMVMEDDTDAWLGVLTSKRR